jgi:hypothetical protein
MTRMKDWHSRVQDFEYLKHVCRWQLFNCSAVCVCLCIWKWLVYVLNGNEILAKNRPDHAHIISCLWPERHLESYLTPECAAASRCDRRQKLESWTVASFRRQALIFSPLKYSWNYSVFLYTAGAAITLLYVKWRLEFVSEDIIKEKFKFIDTYRRCFHPNRRHSLFLRYRKDLARRSYHLRKPKIPPAIWRALYCFAKVMSGRKHKSNSYQL